MQIPSTLSKMMSLVRLCAKSILRCFVVEKISNECNTIYLTFDDGPCQKNTEIIYEALKTMGVTAGFFFNGNAALRHKKLVQKIYSDGYYVGNHSYLHTKFTLKQWYQELKSIGKGKEIIASITNDDCKFYRPPFGKIRLLTLIYLLIKRYKIILWSVDSRDFSAANIGEVINNINGVVSGDILLFHSDCDLTATHIHSIVCELSAKGYRFGNLYSSLQ